MEAFRANRKSARACRGELSSSSMVDTKASAMAWSDTARPLSRDLLSSRMVDLKHHPKTSLRTHLLHHSVSSEHSDPRTHRYLKCPVVATCRTRMGKRARMGL